MPDKRSRKYGVKKRGDRWIARPYIPGHGHVWVGTFDTEDEALRAAIERFDQLKRRPASKETIKSFRSRWLTDYPRNKRSTMVHYESMTKALEKEHGDTLLREFGNLDARRFFNKHKGAARTAKVFFSDAKSEGLIETNPFAGIKLQASRGRRDIDVPSEQDIQRLAALAEVCHPKYPFAKMIAFSAYTGMRPSEVYGLEWSDIDFVAGEIHVQRQLYRHRCSTPKNGRDRKIILPPPAGEAVEALKAQDRFSPVVMEDETGKERPMDLIFRNKSGDPMSQTTLHFYWVPVRAAFGRPEMDFYDLRHFCATFLLERFRAAGEDGSYDVAIQLGHTDEGELVRDLYGHPSDDLSRERLKRLFNQPTELRPVGESDEEAVNG